MYHVVMATGDDVTSNKFRINSLTGLIETTANRLDREAVQSFTLRVEANDQRVTPRAVSHVISV